MRYQDLFIFLLVLTLSFSPALYGASKKERTVNHAPVMNGNQKFTISTGTTLHFTLAGASDLDNDSLTYTLVTPPSSGEIINCLGGTAGLSCDFIPLPNMTGEVSFVYKANDGLADSINTAKVVLRVNLPNHPPVLSDTFVTEGSENSSIPFTLPSASDQDLDSLLYEVVVPPQSGVLKNCLDSTSNLNCTFVPVTHFYGDVTFSYRAKDLFSVSNTSTVTIHITKVNHPPVMNGDQEARTEQNSSLQINLKGGYDVHGDQLTYRITRPPEHGSLENCFTNAKGLSCVYIPTTNYYGRDFFTYIANDGEQDAQKPSTVFILVGRGNFPPVMGADQNFEINQNESINFALNPATDSDGDTLTYRLLVAPTSGVLTNCLDGTSNLSCSYRPLPTFSGTVTFTFLASDGLLEASKAETVKIHVKKVNHLPMMNGNQTFTAIENSPLAFTLAGATDLDKDSLTYEIVAPPTTGSLTSCLGKTSNLSCEFVPAPNMTGPVTFSYRASDGLGYSTNTSKVTLMVNHVEPKGSYGNFVYGYFTQNSKTVLDLCELNGERVGTYIFPQKMDDFGTRTIFYDLNNDGKPDLLHLNGFGLEVYYNESTNGHVSFSSKQLIAPLSLPTNYYSFWIKDMNGDGQGDIVLKGDSTIYVFFGDIEGHFKDSPLTFDFYLPSGRLNSKNLADAQVHFVDANKDGLPDILLQGEGFISLHLNTGYYFIQKEVPGLFVGSDLYRNLVVGDMEGSGNTQVVSSSLKGKALVLDFDRPSLGLLTDLDDGQGNQIKLTYQNSKPEIGKGERKAVVKTLVKASLGDGITTFSMDYSGLRLKKSNSTFLGFSKVTVEEKLRGKTENNYIYDLGEISRLKSKSSFDLTNPDLIKYETNLFSPISFAGLGSSLLTKKQEGYKNGTFESKKITTYLYDEQNLCETQTQAEGDGLVLKTTKSYWGNTSFPNFMSCFLADVRIEGTGLDLHLGIVRDLYARPIEIYEGQPSLHLRQKATYTSNGLLNTLEEVGKGVTSYDYDSLYRLKSVVSPDFTKKEVVSYAANDLPLLMRDIRDQKSYETNFRYDGHERLSTQWDNLGLFTEALPQNHYEYYFGDSTHPSRVVDESKVETKSYNFSTAQTIYLASATGKELGKVVSTFDDNQKITGLTRFKNEIGQKRIFQDYLTSGLDAQNLLFSELDFSKDILLWDDHNFFSQSKNLVTAVQEGVKKTISTSFSLSDSGFLKTQTENGQFSKDSLSNSWDYPLSYKNEAGDSYSYETDALGRIRVITLPSGEKHHFSYSNDNNLLSRVERDGVGSIEFDYDPITNSLVEKRFYGVLGTLDRKYNFTYDFAGRVLSKTVVKNNKSTQYQFHYDGQNLSQSEKSGQTGFLTGVSSPQYSKETLYRPDGKVLLERIFIPQWRSIQNTYEYYSHGALKSKTQILRDASAGVLLSSTEDYEYNKLGEPTIIKRNGSEFANFSYNNFGELEELAIPQKDILISRDVLTREGRDYQEKENGNTSLRETLFYSNRGHISQISMKLHERELSKEYSYDSRGYLASLLQVDTATDTQKLGFGYDNIGLLNSKTKDGVSALLPNYTKDDLGRVVSKDGKDFIYGENGKISEVRLNGILLATYFFDEEDKPLLKVYENGTKEFYLNDSFLNDDMYLEPLKLGQRVVGYFKNGVFVKTGQDHLNSVALDENSNVNLNSPYGERDVRSESSNVLDFTLKGFDKEIGAVRMGHRYYDPTSAKFLTPDPLFLESSEKCLESPVECSLFGYAGNDPIGFLDPDGLTKWPSESREIVSKPNNPNAGLYGPSRDGGTKMHYGIDIKGSSGAKIISMDKGTVVDARWQNSNNPKSGWGQFILIKHINSEGKNYFSIYSHLSSINVKAGQKVEEGQAIGQMGNSGNAYNEPTHLHLETRLPGKSGEFVNSGASSVNPSSVFPNSDKINEQVPKTSIKE